MKTHRPLQAGVPDHEGAIAGAAYTRHRRIHRSRSHPRPRILQLLATGGNGGAQESYTGLLLRLDRSRYDVRALSLSAGSAVQRLRALGIPVDVLDATDDEVAVRELAGWLRHNEIDLVHAHMFRAEVIGTRAAVAAGTPVIMATVHSSRVRSPEDIALLASLTPRTDRLIVPSASIEHKVRSEGREGARFAVIPNGVDLERFATPVPPCAMRNELGIPREAPLVGVVARLEPEKGHRHLVEAMPMILEAAPNAWLAIVGEGSEADALRAQAASLGGRASERIVFTGRRVDVSAITADLTVAALPSLREAQGISILEAMARRRPVVASAVGGIPEVITDGVDGLLVPPADPTALAAAIGPLLADPSLRERIGEAGYRTVAERFSIDAQVKRTEVVYDEELARAGVIGAFARPEPVATARPAQRGALELPPI
ncbi:MAG TPA: glycosyltransferase family 4 protein [Candidatus Limnocylindrales bacterium]|nr:glycosyltransferase family 4 protein [Candidatus Limnocylindrales bacterium]